MGPTGLGVARGAIQIDTQDLSRVEVLTRSVGTNVARSFGQVDASVKRTVGGIGQLNTALGGLLGGFGALRIAQFALQANEVATAYARQSLAAVNLAGSQEKLNDLLAVYDRVTGGVIDRATALSEVTKLQAIGFADTTQELERFATAARGISIATGKPLDYVISELQLTIANQSERRFDQIALGIDEVKAKIAQLKAENSGLSDAMIFQNAVLGVAEQKFGALVKSQEAQKTGAEEAAKAAKDASLELGQAFGPIINAAMHGVAEQIKGISGLLQQVGRDATEAGDRIREMQGGKPGESILPGIMTTDYPHLWASQLQNGVGWGQAWDELWNGRNVTPRFGGGGQGGGFGGGGGGGGFGSNMAAPPDPNIALRRQEQIDFGRQIADIERNANEQRIDAERSYGQQRSEVIASYGRSIVREEEDFLRQRGRAVAQFNREVADLQSQAAERDAQWAADLADRIADIQSDGNKRISEIEENYQKEREQREADHKDRLFSAASRLDAQAVADEMRSYKRQSEEADDRHKEQIDKIQEDIAERIAQEQEEHNKRLDAARKADAERLADMQRDFAERKAQEDEDRATRLERMAEDHQAQLDQMDAAQADRIDQIKRHAEEDKKAAEDAHIKAMQELGVVLSDSWVAIQKSIEAAMIKEAEEFEKKLKEKYEGQGRTDRLGNPSTPYIPQYADGGWVNRTGAIYAHAGEYVVNRQMAAAMAGMRGGSAMNVGGINIYAAPGMDPAAIAEAVDGRLRTFFVRLAQ